MAIRTSLKALFGIGGLAEQPQAEQAVVGHPPVINPPPGAKGTYERNLERIERLKVGMAKLERKGMKQSKAWKGLELELERRRMAVRQYELQTEMEA